MLLLLCRGKNTCIWALSLLTNASKRRRSLESAGRTFTFYLKVIRFELLKLLGVCGEGSSAGGRRVALPRWDAFGVYVY